MRHEICSGGRQSSSPLGDGKVLLEVSRTSYRGYIRDVFPHSLLITSKKSRAIGFGV